MLYLARVQPIIILSSLSGIQLPEYGSPSDPLCPSWGVNSSWVLTHLGLGVRSVWFSDLLSVCMILRYFEFRGPRRCQGIPKHMTYWPLPLRNLVSHHVDNIRQLGAAKSFRPFGI